MRKLWISEVRGAKPQNCQRPRRGTRLPRRGKGQICPINRFEGPAVYGCYFLSSLSRFTSFCVPEVPRSPGNIPETRSKSRDPEDPEKCGSRAEALPARSSIFVKIFQIYRRILLLQVVVLSDHLLIKWVCSYFLLTHNYEVFYTKYVLCVYFVLYVWMYIHSLLSHRSDLFSMKYVLCGCASSVMWNIYWMKMLYRF